MESGSEFILNKIKLLQDEINSFKYNSNDVRDYFYGMLQSNLVSYARGYLFLEISKNIKSNALPVPQDIISYRQFDLITKSSETFKNEVAYLSHYHRNLLISSWSSFELLITSVCETLLDPITKELLLTSNFDDIIKKLKIPDNKEREKFSVKRLTHVPISRKYSELFKLGKKEYSRDIKVDKKFLEFFRDFRNTIHTNFIYYGTDNKEFKFTEITFKFNKEKVVGWNDPFPLSPELYLNLIFELKNITTSLLNFIDHKDVILYPDLEAQNFD